MSLSAVIIGAGPAVGRHVGDKLLKEGWKVALGNRKPDVAAAKADGFHAFSIDITASDGVLPALEGAAKELGSPANVVIYNASVMPKPSNPSDPLSVPLAEVKTIGEAGINSVWEAARFATAGFAKLPPGVPKVFILTGNALPFLPPVPGFLTLGLGKGPSAYLIGVLSQVYAPKGFQFYYATQINSNSSLYASKEFGPKPHVSAFWELIQRKEQGDWDARFTIEGKILPK